MDVYNPQEPPPSSAGDRRSSRLKITPETLPTCAYDLYLDLPHPAATTRDRARIVDPPVTISQSLYDEMYDPDNVLRLSRFAFPGYDESGASEASYRARQRGGVTSRGQSVGANLTRHDVYLVDFGACHHTFSLLLADGRTRVHGHVRRYLPPHADAVGRADVGRRQPRGGGAVLQLGPQDVRGRGPRGLVRGDGVLREEKGSGPRVPPRAVPRPRRPRRQVRGAEEARPLPELRPDGREQRAGEGPERDGPRGPGGQRGAVPARAGRDRVRQGRAAAAGPRAGRRPLGGTPGRRRAPVLPPRDAPAGLRVPPPRSSPGGRGVSHHTPPPLHRAVALRPPPRCSASVASCSYRGARAG